MAKSLFKCHFLLKHYKSLFPSTQSTILALSDLPKELMSTFSMAAILSEAAPWVNASLSLHPVSTAFAAKCQKFQPTRNRGQRLPSESFTPLLGNLKVVKSVLAMPVGGTGPKNKSAGTISSWGECFFRRRGWGGGPASSGVQASPVHTP